MIKKLLFGLSCFLLPATAFSKQVLVSFGDSITRGFDTEGIGDNTKFSWATGDEINSIWRMLSPEEGDEVYNLAVSGATSADVGWQLLFLPDEPTQATILVGANDVCRGVPNDEITANIKYALDYLYKKNKDIKITLVPVPKLTSLYEARKNDTKCQVLWTVTGICSGFIGPYTDDETRANNQKSLASLNQTLENIVEGINRTNLHPRINFNASIGEMDLLPDDISDVDCFHPSIKGQQRLADMASVE